MPSTWSPSTTVPEASTAMSRSASPSSANPTSAPRATTSAASEAGLVAPDATLMFTPSGSLWRTSTRAPVASRIAGATTPPDPFAQSTTTWTPRAPIPDASVRRWCTYRSSRSLASRTRPSDAFVAPPSSSARQISCSRPSSTASSSLRPSASRTLRPLSSAGLCDADTMIPA
jgi:hypothetical protein